MGKTLNIWTLPGVYGVLNAEKICEQVRKEVSYDPEVETYYFVRHKETVVVAFYPTTPELAFLVGDRMEQLIQQAGGGQPSPEFIQSLIERVDQMSKMSADELFEIIFEALPLEQTRGH